MSAISVPAAFKRLVNVLAQMFYSGQCPPAWWVDAADPKKPENPAAEELAMFEEKKAAQLAREAKRKAQAREERLVLLTVRMQQQLSMPLLPAPCSKTQPAWPSCCCRR